jgi:molybdate transport system substrate-binding protein
MTPNSRVPNDSGLLASKRPLPHFAPQRLIRRTGVAANRSLVRDLVLAIFGSALLSIGQPTEAATVNVFAAASLTDSLKEIALAYSRQSEDKIVFNFAASSTLARQIEEGAPADIFFSTDEAKMDGLQKQGLIDAATRRSRLSNALAIVVAADPGASIASPKDLRQQRIRRVAVGDPRAVPVGVYAREYLQRQGLWPALQPKLVMMENVRAALSAVETGDADAAIVYTTDALISKKVKIAFAIPTTEGPKISYPVALVKEAKEPEAGRKFLSYLESDQATKVFERYGFIVIARATSP